MPRKAIRNTYGYEDVAGVEVRRQVMAGTLVPDHYRVEDPDALAPDPTQPKVVAGVGSSPAPASDVKRKRGGKPSDT